jgi:hypothetical protein
VLAAGGFIVDADMAREGLNELLELCAMDNPETRDFANAVCKQNGVVETKLISIMILHAEDTDLVQKILKILVHVTTPSIYDQNLMAKAFMLAEFDKKMLGDAPVGPRGGPKDKQGPKFSRLELVV